MDVNETDLRGAGIIGKSLQEVDLLP